MYCIDSCVLIEASRRFYASDFFSDFWWWLSQKGKEGIWTSPLQVYKEIVENTNKKDKNRFNQIVNESSSSSEESDNDACLETKEDSQSDWEI